MTHEKLLWKGLRASERVMKELRKRELVKKVSAAGAVRRMKDTFKKVIIVCSSPEPLNLMEDFQHSHLISNILYKTEQRLSFLLEDDVRVDLIIVRPGDYANTLLYFTGSLSHTRKLRTHASKQGITINKDGVFKRGERVDLEDERSIYEVLNMQFIPPELRQGKDELRIALDKSIPELIKREDIRGDLHVHSKWSDGVNTIKQIADYCRDELNYSYVGIADHAGHIGFADSLDEKRLRKRREVIKDLNSTYSNFKVLNCAEVDIKTNGDLSIRDTALSKLDVVIASVHYKYEMSKRKMTRRLCKALSNEYVGILGHPTGRKVLSKPGVDFDMNKVFRTGVENNVCFEIDSKPYKMDLNDEMVRRAKSLGAHFTIDSDAHKIEQLHNLLIGVGIGKRGMLESSDVVNTQSTSSLQKTGLVQ